MDGGTAVKLPPGQRALAGFPRFGTHLGRPAPAVPSDPVIEIGGAVARTVTLPLAELATLPRTEITADFHCVAGWSATGLRWEGVAFETFYREVVEPRARPDAAVSHVAFAGLDGHRSVVTLEDALSDDVLIAEQLDGRPLDPDHGAPARLVSPGQYGYVSTKHLCRIELHTTEPKAVRAAHPVSQVLLRGPLVKAHPRARVWEEERHPYLPARALRPFYRLTIPGGIALGRRGRGRAR
jgi:DMSO/TMAO reductase YedYZ molybdopterin-dependent catalytic subunit